MVHIFNGVMPFDVLLLWEFNFVYRNFFCNIILQEQTFRIGPDWFFSMWFDQCTTACNKENSKPN